MEITAISRFVNVAPVGFVGFSMGWSPEGIRLLYFSDLGGKCGCLNSATTEWKKQHRSGFQQFQVGLVADGTKIVLSRFDGPSSRIYVMDAKRRISNPN
jgi:hypothetical protein